MWCDKVRTQVRTQSYTALPVLMQGWLLHMWHNSSSTAKIWTAEVYSLNSQVTRLFLMGNQEIEMGNWNKKKKKRTNHWCSGFFTDSWVVCFVITFQCDWLALPWQTTLQPNLVHVWVSGNETSYILTMRIHSLRLRTRLMFLPRQPHP